MVRLRKRARRPSKSLLRKLEKLSRKPVSELTEKDIELLEKYNLLRSRRALTLDFRKESHVPKYVGTWLRHPGRYDIPGVDTPSSPQAVEVLEEARKRKEKREARKRASSKHELEVKYSGEWAKIEGLGTLTTNSRRGKLYIYTREHAQLLKRLIRDADSMSFMYIDGSESGFIGMDMAHALAFDVKLEHGAEGYVWPAKLEYLPTEGLKKESEIIVTPSNKEGYVNVTVRDKYGKITMETPQLKAWEVDDVLDRIRKLNDLMWKPRYVEMKITDAKALRRLRSVLRKGKDVEISADGIRVYTHDKIYSFKNGLDLIVKDYLPNAMPIYVNPELLLDALPSDPNTSVSMIVPNMGGNPGPVIIKWSDGIANATFFIAPRIATPYMIAKPSNIQHEVTLPPEVVDELVKVPVMRKKYGEINMYLTRDYLYFVDDGNTAVLAVKLPIKLSIPEGKVVKIEDMKTFKDIIRDGLAKLIVDKSGYVWVVNDRGDSALVGDLMRLNDVRVNIIVKDMEREGPEKFMRRITSEFDKGEVKRDTLLKGVKRKFNMLSVRKTSAGDAVIELVEESKGGDEKLVFTLGDVKNASLVDKGFSIGRRYASVKPWLEAFTKLSKNYAVEVGIGNNVVAMHSGDAWLAITSSYG